MGGSVGIGGLIIGISMLVVFSMAYQSINSQISSGLDRIDDAEQPIPTFTIDDATLWEGAVVGYTISTPGTLYTNGTLTTSTGGFAGTYTVDGGGTIIDVVITSHGNYSSAPTPTITCSTPCSSNSGNAAIGFTLGNAVHANFTNLGSTTIDFDEIHLYKMSKEEVMKAIEDKVIKKQHGGNKASSGTFCYNGPITRLNVEVIG